MSAGHGEIRLRREQCCGVDGCLRPAWKDGVCSTCWRAYRWLRSPADPAENTLRWLEAVWSLPAAEGEQAA
jgi:hypothetical protein